MIKEKGQLAALATLCVSIPTAALSALAGLSRLHPGAAAGPCGL